MTHPLDKPLGPVAQSECRWSYHDGFKMQYDFMCLLPLSKTDAECVIETMKLAMGVIGRSCGLEPETARAEHSAAPPEAE